MVDYVLMVDSVLISRKGLDAFYEVAAGLDLSLKGNSFV